MNVEVSDNFKPPQDVREIVVPVAPSLLEDALVKEYFRQIQKISAEEALAPEPLAVALRNIIFSARR